MEGKWIWIQDHQESENERGCFTTEFYAGGSSSTADMKLMICGVTRYIVYLNGKEMGRGPIRSGPGELFYDSYDMTPDVIPGRNFLAVRVWNYGWSTYQTLAQEGGVWFQISSGEEVLAASGAETKCARDRGHISHTVKRNVNLGFSDYYNANCFDSRWVEDREISKNWGTARVLEERENRENRIKQNPLRQFQRTVKTPGKIVRIQEVIPGCQQISVNTRNAFFPGRKDADETIFSGFLGCEFLAPQDMEGVIAFPNRTWNGIIGDFTIDGKLYEVSNEHREIPVHVTKGKHFFLLQISGKFDDLYCHMEWCFPEKLKIVPSGVNTPLYSTRYPRQLHVCEFSRIPTTPSIHRCTPDTDFRHYIPAYLRRKSLEGDFFVKGPTYRIIPVIDGFGKVYGGLDEYNRLEEYPDLHKRLFAASSLEEMLEIGGPVTYVDRQYIYEDAYIYSLAKRDQVIAESAVQPRHLGMLWDNQEVTRLEPPVCNGWKRIIVDFEDIYAGSLEFTIKAPAGTILDIYGFENMYQGEIDYTIGLNNSVRYICKEGWQSYRCMARMGMRYAMLTFRDCREEVLIRDFRINYATYAPGNFGGFTCDDYLLNRIFEMCRHTHQLCMEDSFTDCPTYEQAFWIGDAGISAVTCAYLFGDYDLIKRSIQLSAEARANTPLLNALTPTDWNTSIPMWTMNWIISIFQYGKISGDTGIFPEMYGVVKETLKYYAGFIQEDGGFLINAWNMMDWADMDIHNYGVVTGQQAVLAYCYGLAAAYAEKSKFEEDAAFFESCQIKLLLYMETKLWDHNKNMYRDGFSPEYGMSRTFSIQTHILMLLYDGILDVEKKHIVENYITDPPVDMIQAGSPFMLYYQYECLAKKGRMQEIMDDIKTRWGEMLKYDSTTCWEVFPGFYEVSRTRSYCHSWSASPAYFFIKYALGVQMLEDGFKKVEIVEPSWDMKWCRGDVPTPHGAIHIEWIREEGRRECRVRVPREIEVVFAETKWDFSIDRIG